MKYRTYIHKNSDHGVEFISAGKDKWECIHGDWVGTVKDGDELTLHHTWGESNYDSYKEHNKSKL